MTTDTNAAYREMVENEQNEIRRRIRAALPAIEALAKTSPYAFAEIKTFGVNPQAIVGDGLQEPSIRIDFPMPGSNTMTVTGHLKQSRTWKVVASMPHFTVDDYGRTTCENLQLTAQVIQVAASIAAYLRILAPTS